MTKSFSDLRSRISRITIKVHNLPQYTAIVVGVFLAHGLLLFNDGIYWDGWIYYSHLATRNWDLLYEPFRDAGYPLQAYMMWFIARLGDVTFSNRIVSFILIVFAGLFIFRISRESRQVNKQNSLAIAVLCTAYPVFQTAIAINIVPILASYTMFFLGVLLSLRSEQFDRWKHYGLRVGALLAFIISFVWRSFLVFYFGFLFLLLVYWLRVKGGSVRNSWRYLLIRLDFALLPFLYWIFNGIVFPERDLYSNYNKFVSSSEAFRFSFSEIVNFGILRQLNRAITELISHPWLWLFLILSIMLTKHIIFLMKRETRLDSLPTSPGWGLLGFGLILLVLGIFPYAIVGKSVSLNDFASRNALLVSLPLAFILVALRQIVFQNREMGGKLGWLILGSLWLGFALTSNNDYLSWQARWVKDRSLMMKLGQLDGAEKYSVYLVDDQYLLGGEDNYRFYEWSSMFKQVWGDETRVGFDQRYFSPSWLAYHKPYYTQQYNLSSLDPAGCQATLTILRGSSAHSEFDLVLHYFYYKFLRPQSMQAFLSGVTQIEIQPSSSPSATNCKPH